MSNIIVTNWNDREHVLEAVLQNGMALEYAPAFQNDKEVVLAAVRQYGRALEYASRALQDDKEVVLAAVRHNGDALEYAPAFQNDKEVVLAAVRQNGVSLGYAPAFQNDKEVVLAAVRQYGMALEHASRALQDDKEVVLAAVRHPFWGGGALKHASDGLIADREVVLAAVRHNRDALRFAPAFQNDSVLLWFVKHSDRLTKILGEDKLNYDNLKELYSNCDLDILKNLNNKDREQKIDTEPGQRDETAIMFAQIMREKLSADTSLLLPAAQ